jgi:hypothetical protein
MKENEEKSPVIQNLEIVRGAGVFDTKTGQGDPFVIKSLKKSCEGVAGIVLSENPSNLDAQALLEWANDSESLEPDINILLSTYRAAGLMTSSFYFDPESKKEK